MAMHVYVYSNFHEDNLAEALSDPCDGEVVLHWRDLPWERRGRNRTGGMCPICLANIFGHKLSGKYRDIRSLLYDNILFSSHMEICNMIISITWKHGMFV